MSREIVEAVQALEREKGISSERLMAALEDALLSAYKKTPGSAKYARVDMDRGSADFRVFELLVPEELYERVRARLSAEGGVFGAHMQIDLVNDGPVTLVVEV